MKTTQDIMEEKSFSDCLMDIMPFLTWAADTDEILGGVNGKDALESFRVLLGYDEETFAKLCNIFRQEEENEQL